MATFLSKYAELKIVIAPKITPEQTFGRSDTGGAYIQFHNGQYTTTNKDEILFLKSYNPTIVTMVPEDEEPPKPKAREVIKGSRNTINAGSAKQEPQN